MATATLQRAHSGRQRLLSVGQVCREWSVHPNSLRRWADEGTIPCVTLPSGHRRFLREEMVAHFEGIDPADNSPAGCLSREGICVYCRVSDVSQDSKGQDGKSSLTRQIDRLLDVVSGREKIERENIVVYKDVASSFGDREGLNRMIDGVIDGTVKKIYCLYLDRLSRVPALTRLLEHICRRFNVEIIAVDVEDSEGQEIWQKELLNYITVWCNRQSAAKSVLVTRKDLTPECIRRILELKKDGRTIRAIVGVLKEEGYVMTNAAGGSFEINYSKVQQILSENGEAVLSKVLVGGSVKMKESCKGFIEERIQQSEYQDRISVKSVYGDYVAFCESRNVEPQPRAVLGRSMSKVFGKYNKVVDGVRLWCGLRLGAPQTP